MRVIHETGREENVPSREAGIIVGSRSDGNPFGEESSRFWIRKRFFPKEVRSEL